LLLHGLCVFARKKASRRTRDLGVDGEKRLMVAREKTDVLSRIPLLPSALQIIDRYQKEGVEDGPLLPVLPNQKMNAYLKEIADVWH
jgi:hypothetical protein